MRLQLAYARCRRRASDGASASCVASFLVAAIVCRGCGAARSTSASSSPTSGASRATSPALLRSSRFGARFWADLAEWFWGLKRWLRLLGDTLLIAYVGTVARRDRRASCSASSPRPISAASLRCASSSRALLEFCRTVPEIVFALIFVIAFGLGPLPGVLAIAIHTTGALGKLFAEVVENIDMKPVEGVDRDRRRAGWQIVRFAVAAAGAVELRQLRAAALRDQRARRRGHGLRRRRRHRPGPDRGRSASSTTPTSAPSCC